MRKHILLTMLWTVAFASAQEYRSSFESTQDLNKHWAFDYKGEYRVDNDKSKDNHFVFATAKLNYKFSSTYKMGIGARYGVNLQDAFEFHGDEDNSRYRMVFDTKYKGTVRESGWNKYARLRYQVNTKRYEEMEQMARLRLGAKNHYSQNLNLYISYENFFDLDEYKVEKHRFNIGSSIDLGKHELEIFYISDIRFIKKNLNTEHALGVAFIW